MEMERFSGSGRNGNGLSGGGLQEEGERIGGEIRLPIGFRFRPTDEELLVHYLKRRALSLPLPASIIPEFDVFRSDPWDLPGDLTEKKRFYFMRIVGKSTAGGGKHCTHCSATSTTCSGFWKAIGKPKQILAASSNQQQQVVVGTRKLWVFYQEQHSPHGWFRTNWYIHEFHLPKMTSTTTHQTTTIPVMQNPSGQMWQDWVVCKVFQRKRKQQKRHEFLLASGHTAAAVNNKCIGDCNLGVKGMPSYIDFKLEVEEKKLELGPPEAEPCSPPSSFSSSVIDHPMFC